MIADFDACEKMIKGFIHKMSGGKKGLFAPKLKIVVGISKGGALLCGIAKRFSDRMNMTFHIAEDPLKAVARGTCKAIEDTEKYKYKFLMR